MICKFCGNVIEDNSDFCFICGQKVVTDTPAYSAQVYSQKPEGAPAEVAPEAPAAPVAPAEPVYAPPVLRDEDVCRKCKKVQRKKKMENVKANLKTLFSEPALSKKEKVIIGLLPALFLVLAGVMCKNIIVVAICLVLTGVMAILGYKMYNKANEEGYEEKAVDILNTGMIGICVGMAVIVLCLVKTYMLG